jgi:hypothetical protein
MSTPVAPTSPRREEEIKIIISEHTNWRIKDSYSCQDYQRRYLWFSGKPGKATGAANVATKSWSAKATILVPIFAFLEGTDGNNTATDLVA